MSKPVCAVMGGSGFLGHEAVPVLRADFEVVPTAARSTDPAYTRLDLRDPDAVASFCADVRPDAVVVLAAYREPDVCEEQPEETRRLNTAPLGVLASILPPEVPLVFVSTDYVFDGAHPPYREDSPRCPLNVYGASKVEAEDFVLARPRASVLRVPLLMGWMETVDSSGFFSQLVKDLKHEGPLDLDDVLARYPVWTRDAGEAIRTLLADRRAGAFHYSTPRRLTRYRAAVEMGELLGWPTDHLKPSHTVIPRRAARPHDAQLATDKWTGMGYVLPHDFREVARCYIQHFDLMPGGPV
jgi:dTDP-4-dehydrorhamnose reductase